MVALPPRDRPQLRCCGASGCRSVGAEALLAALRVAAATDVGGLGEPGEALEVRSVGCLRLCGQGPLVALDGPQGTSLYGGVPPERAGELVAQARAAASPQASWDPALADHRLDLEHPFFCLQRPLVLEGCGLVDPARIEDALAQGTYAQLRRVLQEFSPEQVRDQVRRSGLRGRGGGGYPTGLKWDTVALQPPGQRYVVCNADEGDHGAFMDRSVLEGDPHRLLEGMAIAAYAVGAEHGYLYVRAEYPLAIERLRLALGQARRQGLLGRGIAGSSFNLELEVRVGAGAYVCGEETALLHSIQGQRGTPRTRPPYPAQAGLWGAPTLINNVETLAAVPVILRQGGDWYAAIGTDGSHGTKVFSLSGAIRHTGLVEVPMGTSLRTVVETMGGGDPDGGAVKAVQTGGPSGGCIPAALLDTPVDFESLLALVLGLGFYGGWWARSLPWFSAAKPVLSEAAAERQRLKDTGWREADAGVFVRPCAGNCRPPRVFGGGAVEVLEVECLERPCGQIRATFNVLAADGAPLDTLTVTADGRQGERLQLVAETPNPLARRLVLGEFSARARLD